MNGFGMGVVADLCEAFAELIETAPKVALYTARKLSLALRRRVETAEQLADRELQLREKRAAAGQSDF